MLLVACGGVLLEFFVLMPVALMAESPPGRGRRAMGVLHAGVDLRALRGLRDLR